MISSILIRAVTSAILKLGAASSSVIVKVAVESLIVALDAFDKVIVAVSLTSSSVSAKTGTLNVPVVAPADIVNVPEVGVKSELKSAVPFEAHNLPLHLCPDAAERLTVNVALAAFSLTCSYICNT